MKFWKCILAVVLLNLSFNVNAAFIDNGAFTTDTNSGLDWLDLSLNSNTSYNSALGLNPGWRYATNSEVVNLFTAMFSAYVETSAVMHWYASAVPSPTLYAEAINFGVLFGETITGGSSSVGRYEDEDGRIRLMGMQRTFGNGLLVYGDEFTEDLTAFPDEALPELSTFLVRTSVVPVPAAVWLFGSGFIGLLGFLKRNTR